MSEPARSGHCYIGLTQWQHAAWQDNFLLRSAHTHVLNAYSRHFSSVEGNTTFYALPKAETVDQWLQESAADFRFCFKFPQQISHQQQLRHCEQETREFLQRIGPLQEKLGLLCIQLPGRFSPSELDSLSRYLQSLPPQFQYGVEVRHPDFFNKRDEERRFNRLLSEHQVNRISFDTRSLFAHPATDPISMKAKEHKPQVPVHAVATGQQPMIRLITPLDWPWAEDYITPWLTKACSWMDQGLTPYFFFHTPDNAEAPALAAHFVERLEQMRPGCCRFSPWQDPRQSQTRLF
ncbi:DUF72 domain-containing protein [Neptuniibacter halophilus]|uniref:DUF72 domain-containing protein n=1 Tax=Neptuniibacter halophilus TaxID=651666 RepID=UPI0025730039|nr:DUF72 domain-containing protein [Neptuniibacter halophilus]